MNRLRTLIVLTQRGCSIILCEQVSLTIVGVEFGTARRLITIDAEARRSLDQRLTLVLVYKDARTVGEMTRCTWCDHRYRLVGEAIVTYLIRVLI